MPWRRFWAHTWAIRAKLILTMFQHVLLFVNLLTCFLKVDDEIQSICVVNEKSWIWFSCMKSDGNAAKYFISISMKWFNFSPQTLARKCPKYNFNSSSDSWCKVLAWKWLQETMASIWDCDYSSKISKAARHCIHFFQNNFA